MKKQIVSFFALALPFLASAQLPFFTSAFDTIGGSGHHYEISAIGGYQAGSNALTNRFLNTIYTGGFIDTTLKSEVEDKLLLHNRFGVDADYGMIFRVHPDSSRYAWFAGIRNRYHADAAFAGDLFRLGMSGNRRFAGKTAMLGSTAMKYMHWQQITGGISFQGNEGATSISAGLSLIKGQEAITLEIPKADLFTEANGFAIDLDAEYLFNQTDTSKRGIGAMNGIGAAVDFILEARTADSVAGPIRWWRFAVLDAGLIRWNNQSMYYQRDTSYHFTGITINSLSDLQDSTLSQWSADTLTGKAEKKSFTTNLPTTALLEGKTKNFGKFQPGFGIKMRLYANCAPEYFVNVIYRPVPVLRVMGEAGYGGYNGFRFSLDVQTSFSGWLLRAGTYNALAWVIPAQTTGQGIFAGLAKRF